MTEIEQEQDRRIQAFREWLDAPMDLDEFYGTPKPISRAWRIARAVLLVAAIIALCVAWAMIVDALIRT